MYFSRFRRLSSLAVQLGENHTAHQYHRRAWLYHDAAELGPSIGTGASNRRVDENVLARCMPPLSVALFIPKRDLDESPVRDIAG